MSAEPWTTKQEGVLRAYAHLGASGVREALLRECGVDRSERAIEAHASRIHASLRQLAVCPQCGAVGVRLNRTSGMCALCTERGHVEEERAFGELLRAEAEERDGGPEVEAARREYARLRKANSRYRRRHGLRGRRGRL